MFNQGFTPGSLLKISVIASFLKELLGVGYSMKHFSCMTYYIGHVFKKDLVDDIKCLAIKNKNYMPATQDSPNSETQQSHWFTRAQMFLVSAHLVRTSSRKLLMLENKLSLGKDEVKVSLTTTR